MENWLERRAYKRFEMKLPATIVHSTLNNGNEYHLLLTRDISHNGAYFNMMKPLACDGPVQVEILINVPGEGNRSVYLYMKACGEVVRRDDSGLAVIFDEDFLLAPFHL